MTAAARKTTAKKSTKTKTPTPTRAENRFVDDGVGITITPPATSTKPAPPASITAYIATLTTPEERTFAAKQWRHAAGHRATEPSLRGVTSERAKAIREGIAAAIA